MENTITTQDGFTWYILQPKVAKYLHEANYEVYELHEDESESLCIDGRKIKDDSGVRYGIESPLDKQIVHALCGARLVKAFESDQYDACHDIIFNGGFGDLTFFSPFAKPKDVLDNLRGCDAVTFITSDQFLNIITNGK
jgi:hypothetical protein